MIAHMIAPRFAAAGSVPKSTGFGTPILETPNSAIAGFLSPSFQRVFGTLEVSRLVSAQANLGLICLTGTTDLPPTPDMSPRRNN